MKSIFKDIDMNEKELDELWDTLLPLQCLNCRKVLNCTDCNFNETFDKLIAFIIKWGKRVQK